MPALFWGTHGKRNFHIINRESKDAFQLFSLDIFLEQNLVVWSKVFLHEWQEERVENREIKFHVPRKNLRASGSWSFKVSFEVLSLEWLVLDWYKKTCYVCSLWEILVILGKFLGIWKFFHISLKIFLARLEAWFKK